MQRHYYAVYDYYNGEVASCIKDIREAYYIASLKAVGRKIVRFPAKGQPGISVWGASKGFTHVDIFTEGEHDVIEDIISEESE